MTESEIQAAILLACGSLPDVRLFRNHVGEAWHGQAAGQQGGMLLLRNPRRVSFGLHPGSGDLIGWRTRPDGGGQFVSIEVKTAAGRLRAEQETWQKVVRKFGGFAEVARSVDDALSALKS